MNKIYVFPQWSDGDVDDTDNPADHTRGVETYNGYVHGVAVAEDGTLLAGHLSSSIGWFASDMGLTSRRKHDLYEAHYPDGYELIASEPPPEVHARNLALAGKS